MPGTADIKAGDLLVVLAWGSVSLWAILWQKWFPQNAGQPFLTIQAKPVARLNHSRLVMLVFTSERE